jgi:integrase
VNQILDAAMGSKELVIFSILSRTGMRLHEAQNLTWDDVDLDGKIPAIKAKSTSRSIALSDASVAQLRSLPRTSRWVFPEPRESECDRQINLHRIRRDLAMLLVAVRLKGNIHTFRLSLLTAVFASCQPAATLREWAGFIDDAGE